MVEHINVVLKPISEVSLENKVMAMEDIIAYCEEIDLANGKNVCAGFVFNYALL